MPTRPSPIDALIQAGRTYATHLFVLLPVVLVLEGLKAAAMIGLHDALGDNRGAAVGWYVASMLLLAVDVFAVVFVVAFHQGKPPKTPEQLVVRAAPVLLPAIGIGMGLAFLMSIVMSAFRLGLSTQVVVFPAVAVLAVWLDAQSTKGDPAESIQGAGETAARLGGTAVPAALALFAFQYFSLLLIPALADSAVGRHAPLVRWYSAEAISSTLITPVVVMSIAGFFLLLRRSEAEPQDAAPAMPWPQIPGAPPSR